MFYYRSWFLCDTIFVPLSNKEESERAEAMMLFYMDILGLRRGDSYQDMFAVPKEMLVEFIEKLQRFSRTKEILLEHESEGETDSWTYDNFVEDPSFSTWFANNGAGMRKPWNENVTRTEKAVTCTEKAECSWNETFEMFVSYKEENGKLPPTKVKGLGQWMAKHRAILKKLKAADGTNDRLEKFEEHGILTPTNNGGGMKKPHGMSVSKSIHSNASNENLKCSLAIRRRMGNYRQQRSIWEIGW